MLIMRSFRSDSDYCEGKPVAGYHPVTLTQRILEGLTTRKYFYHVQVIYKRQAKALRRQYAVRL